MAKSIWNKAWPTLVNKLKTWQELVGQKALGPLTSCDIVHVVSYHTNGSLWPSFNLEEGEKPLNFLQPPHPGGSNKKKTQKRKLKYPSKKKGIRKLKINGNLKVKET